MFFKKSEEIEAIEDALKKFYELEISGEEMELRIKKVVNELKNTIFTLREKIVESDMVIAHQRSNLELLTRDFKPS
jgi:hypothetical protein